MTATLEICIFDSIIEKETPSTSLQLHDIYKIKTQKNDIVRCFFKVTPIIDPIYYLSGQYGSHIPFVLPEPDHNKWKKKTKWNSLCKSKCIDVNNVAYMDMFFNYIVSVCLPSFVHKVELYDSFSCIKKQMVFNIEDDIYSLRRNTHYKNMKDISFKVEFGDSIPREHTCKFREKELKIEDNKDSTCDISSSTRRCRCTPEGQGRYTRLPPLVGCDAPLGGFAFACCAR